MAKYSLGSIFQSDFPVTQVYGANPDYYGQFGLAGHEGVDYGTPNGTPFIAPFDGIILRDTFNDKDYGNFTVVWDPTQLCAVWFCHLQDVTTIAGVKVTKGEILGHTNNTGNTTGPHCHVNFVETDALGNRLNTTNGFQGFLNILDTNLVSFAQVSPPPAPNPQFTDQTKIPALLLTSSDFPVTSDMEIQAIRGELGDLGRANKQLVAANNRISDLESANGQQATIIASNTATITQLKKDLAVAQSGIGYIPKTQLGKAFLAVSKQFG